MQQEAFRNKATNRVHMKTEIKPYSVSNQWGIFNTDYIEENSIIGKDMPKG